MTKGFLALKDECKRDGKAYITSIKAGKQVSPEGRDYETTLVFVLEFKASSGLNQTRAMAEQNLINMTDSRGYRLLH